MGLTQIYGTLGENAAACLLKKKGYTVLERNYRRKFGEIDIVAKKGNRIVFAEVKTRRNADYGTAGEAVRFHKQKKLIRAAQDYIVRKSLDAAFSFDVIEVYHKGLKITHINHIENAFTV